MSDSVEVPFPLLVPGVEAYVHRVTSPERMALDWYNLPCSDYIHPHLGDNCTLYGFEIGKDTFYSCLGITTPIFLVANLLGRKHPLESLKRTAHMVLQSCLMFGVNTGLYAKLTCSMTRLAGGKNWRGAYFVGPLLAGLPSIFIEKPSRRRELAIYMSNQAIEAIFKMLVSRGYFKFVSFRAGKQLLFASAFAILQYFYHWSSEDMGSSIGGLIKALAGSKVPNTHMDALEANVHALTASLTKIFGKESFYIEPMKSAVIPDTNAQQVNGNKKIEDPSSTKDVISINDADGSKSPTTNAKEHTGLESSRGADIHPSLSPDSLGNHPSSLLRSNLTAKTLFWVNGFIRGYLIGYFIKAVLTLVPSLLSPAYFLRKWNTVLSKSFGTSSMKFGYFLGVIVGLQRLVKVILTSLAGKDRPLIDIAAGFIGGGFGSMLQSGTDLTMYLTSKATEAVVASLVRHKKVPVVPCFVEGLYSLSVGVLFYAATMEPWCLRNSYRTFLGRASGWHYFRFCDSDGLRSLRKYHGMDDLRDAYFEIRKNHK